MATIRESSRINQKVAIGSALRFEIRVDIKFMRTLLMLRNNKAVFGNNKNRITYKYGS